MMKIPLTQSAIAVVDDEDYTELSKTKWYLCRKEHRCYAYSKIGPMHRVILNASDGTEVDHKDGNGLNNQKNNIRLCTHTENMRNSAPPRFGTSKYKGVHWHTKNKEWRSRIVMNRKPIWLGSHTSEIEAAEAYDKKAKELYGDFARLNFCDEQEAGDE